MSVRSRRKVVVLGRLVRSMTVVRGNSSPRWRKAFSTSHARSTVWDSLRSLLRPFPSAPSGSGSTFFRISLFPLRATFVSRDFDLQAVQYIPIPGIGKSDFASTGVFRFNAQIYEAKAPAGGAATGCAAP